MNYAAALAITFGSGAAAAGFGQLVRRFLREGRRPSTQQAGTTIFLQLGVLFSVVLAFVFSAAFAQYNTAEQAIDQERAALHGAAMLAGTLPQADARSLLSLELGYLHEVLDHEWALVRATRHGSARTELALSALIQAASRLAQSRTGEDVPLSNILSLLNTAHTYGTVRLYAASAGLPLALWVVLIAFGIGLVALTTLFEIEHALTRMSFVFAFAACVSAILVLVRLLEYPFEGALALTPAGLEVTLGKVADLLNAS